jgi:uncharacterized protein YsxB (DUF464 family)
VIEAKAELDAEGRLCRFEASGHAGHGRRGQDIVCAAFTVLARTAYESLAALPGAAIEGSAGAPGSLRFAVRRIDEGSGERAIGIADFLLAGISGLEREYPGEVALTIERHWRE